MSYRVKKLIETDRPTLLENLTVTSLAPLGSPQQVALAESLDRLDTLTLSTLWTTFCLKIWDAHMVDPFLPEIKKPWKDRVVSVWRKFWKKFQKPGECA
jgi:hypothetical protein